MTGALQLLFVDDDVDIRTIVTLALGMDPTIAVVAVGSAEAALAALADGRFDAAVLDVSMPGMDGPALLGALRTIVADLPVVFMTAHSRAHELVALYAAGAQGVIVKPFEPLTLAAEVRALLS